MKEIEKNWMTGKSYCEVTSDDDGRLHFEGSYYLDGIAFSFSACEQREGNHIIRGKVSVYSQSQGKLMRSRTKKDNGDPIMIQKSIYPSPPLGTDKSMWKYTVMMFVEKAAQSLLEKNRSLIKHDSELSVTPDSVSPQLALSLYGDEYMRCKHRNASNESKEDYARLLSKAIRALPNEPMRKIKPDDVNRAIKERKLSKQAQRLTKEFWNYCIDSGRCNGTNPFPGETKRRKTAMAKQAEADRLDVLDDEMQKVVYQKVSIEPGGAACGIALMLWGGFDEKTAYGLTWGDLRFEEDRTIVLYFREDNAGATHNYNRNLFPQGSEILQKRYEFLSKRYTAKKLKKMPIVSLNSTAERAMRPDDLNKFGKALLQRLGLCDGRVQFRPIPGGHIARVCSAAAGADTLDEIMAQGRNLVRREAVAAVRAGIGGEACLGAGGLGHRGAVDMAVACQLLFKQLGPGRSRNGFAGVLGGELLELPGPHQDVQNVNGRFLHVAQGEIVRAAFGICSIQAGV